MKINHLTPAEENLMRLLWKLHSFYLKDVMEQHPEPKPHQNTVSTYLKILTEKGYLSTQKEGRIFKYTATVPFEDYRTFLLKELIRHFFNDSGDELLGLLTTEQMISRQDGTKPVQDSDRKPAETRKPEFEYAEEILNPKKEKIRKQEKEKGKEKDKDKDKKKKKKKEK